MSIDGPPASGSMSQETPSLVGQVLDRRYRLTKKLGEGGMGEVYAAEHVHIDKKVAIKLLRPEIVSNKEAVTRFYQEARSSSSIGHRNIIAIDDFGELSDGRIFMCMELLNGFALNDLLQQNPAPDRLLNILIQTGHGLAAAHAKNITHRDMKPENIFVTITPAGEDIPKILDFGIAKVSGNDGQNHLTRTGTIFGTPFYMAPEQALGNPVDQRTDIYAVGVIMYECFAGSLPFQGESFMGILTQHITAEAEPVAQRAAKAGRTLPPGLADIITRCMQKNPLQRYGSMDELVNALIAVYRGLAGPGMSTYMEAFPVGSAQHIAQNTPGAMMRPPNPYATPPPSGAYNAPLPTGGYNAHPSQPMIPGPAGALAPTPSGMYSPASSSSVAVPKKSSTGIIIAILAVLVVGGGITAAVVLSGNNDKPGAGSGSGVAITDPGSSGSAVAIAGAGRGATPGSDLGHGPEHTIPVGSDVAKGSDVANGSDVAKGSDTGTDVAKGSDTSKLVPPPPSVEVLLKSNNVNAFEIWEDGKKVDDGPASLAVITGTPRSLVLKAKGYKDKSITLDGVTRKVQIKLDRVPVIVTHPVDPADKPPPGHPDCTETIVKPKDLACRKQYCAGHASDTRCDAE